MAIVEIVDGLIDLIKKNIIARTDVTSNIKTGDTIINVENSFHFSNSVSPPVKGQEIVMLDNGYKQAVQPSLTSHAVLEYAKIKEVVDTYTLELEEPISTDWYTSDSTNILKTIGHDVLLDANVLYGDREVIPTDAMAITLEPINLSNEWIYLMGGLTREFRVNIIIYGKDINTAEGTRILNLYTDAVYQLFMSDLHPDINNYDTPVLENVSVGSSTVVIEDTTENRAQFVVGADPDEYSTVYDIQDNINVEQGRTITNRVVGGGRITLTVSRPFEQEYLTSEYAAFTHHGIYLYDSRVDNVEFGNVQKGSAYIRVANMSWFGKEVEEHSFPQHSMGIADFTRVGSSSSSESS